MLADAEKVISRLEGKYRKAVEAGDLFFYPSTIHKHVEGGVEYKIRLCPALQHKPRLDTPHFDDTPPEGKPDPFAPPYVRNLYITELCGEYGDEHIVLLNKYSVVPTHFLLATKEYESQSSPLFPYDLVQVYTLLMAARNAGKKFFAFYNCGENSGASQPHKHLQFLPMEDGGDAPMEKLAKAARLQHPDRAFSLPLPYANHVTRLPPNLQAASSVYDLEEVLSRTILNLLDLAINNARFAPDQPAGTPSYNVIITLDHVHVIPRRHESYVLPTTREEISINAIGFFGMPLVKSEQELEALKAEGIGKVLRAVGLPSRPEGVDDHEAFGF
ncbi:hypothetical protein JAAARDRAFT_58243 [Jaapia argillacea MUCL 33604]|uniref:Uncharacterized protein n=1 Tax=Jaapia argillacea MUCL 33604 TaxID=933084 RepID=A0A067Q4X5_9AGAM|nr:hypothetical protein JAAARDRAFT_58243 [Jaapia argillacea MUCL 33604]